MKKEFLNEETRQTVSQLLNVERNALHALHEILRFDFEKPFAAYYLQGAFTPGQALKLAKKNSADPQIIALLMKAPRGANAWYLTRLDKYGKFHIDFHISYFATKNWGIDTFGRKKEIDDWRKREDAETFIVMQNVDFLTEEKTVKKRDLSERFKITPSGVFLARIGSGDRYIRSMDLRSYGSNEKPFEYETPYGYEIPKTNINAIIDKSGYLVLERKISRERKAKELRDKRYIENRRNAYLASAGKDFAVLPEIEDEIKKIKAELIAQLDSASSDKQYEKLGEIVRGSFSLVVYYFSRFKERTLDRSFASVEERDSTYRTISQLLEKLNKKMDELRSMDAE